MDTETLLESVSPNGNIQAIVEQDDRVAYFYLRGATDSRFGLKSCWVRNLVAAPATLDVAAMKRGRPPLLPQEDCSHPSGNEPLRVERLRVVWFEEGDAAALIDGQDVLAVIPSWGGLKGFRGYARDCVAESPLCWPFTSENALRERIRLAEAYWLSWKDRPSPWERVRDSQLAAYTSQVGPYDKYFAIDAGAWPPKALLRIPLRGGFALVTVGVCLRPQPAVEMATQTAATHRRIELGIVVSDDDPIRFERAGRYLSAQSNLPWTNHTWLGPGHTVPCDAFLGTGISAVLLQYEPPSGSNVTLPDFRGDPVRLLWAVGITEQEREFALENGSNALMSRLAQSNVRQ